MNFGEMCIKWCMKRFYFESKAQPIKYWVWALNVTKCKCTAFDKELERDRIHMKYYQTGWNKGSLLTLNKLYVKRLINYRDQCRSVKSLKAFKTILNESDKFLTSQQNWLSTAWRIPRSLSESPTTRWDVLCGAVGSVIKFESNPIPSRLHQVTRSESAFPDKRREFARMRRLRLAPTPRGYATLKTRNQMREKKGKKGHFIRLESTSRACCAWVCVMMMMRRRRRRGRGGVKSHASGRRDLNLSEESDNLEASCQYESRRRVALGFGGLVDAIERKHLPLKRRAHLLEGVDRRHSGRQKESPPQQVVYSPTEA